MDSPRSRPGGRARVAPPADGLVLYRRARSSWRSVQSRGLNELAASQPASPRPAGCPEKEQTRRGKYRAPSAGVGCSDETCGSTNGACTRGYDAEGTSAHTAWLKNAGHTPYFLDWRNHLLDTHEHCLEDDDPLQREEYAAGFKLDRWERFHDLEGNENNRLPSAFLTRKAPHLTETSNRRSRSVPGAIMETRARKRERSSPLTDEHGGRPTARRGVHQTTDGRARVGGPDQGNLRRRS